MSRRTRLRYRALLDQVRLQQALSMLREPDAYVTEIAYDLGYTDAAPFHAGPPPMDRPLAP